MNIICYLFGHKWKYNFPSIANKVICSRCKTKEHLNLFSLEWESVESFENEKRTDDELINEWVN